MIRNILAIVAGIVVGSIGISLVEALGHFIYPLPEGIDFTSPEEIRNYISNAPLGAILFVALAHAVGSFIAGIIITLISRKNQLNASLIGGGVLMIFGLINLILIPHPHWFMVVDLIVYIPLAFIGHKVVYKAD